MSYYDSKTEPMSKVDIARARREYLAHTLDGLKLDVMLNASHVGGIGCPFHMNWGGVIDGTVMNLSRLEKEGWCLSLCGVMYPRLYQPEKCPCHIPSSKGYVKHRFWSFWCKYETDKKERCDG